MTFHVDRQKFEDWLKTKPHGEEILRRWGSALDEIIKQINWQNHLIDEAIKKSSEKIANILNKTEFGIFIRQYLRDTNEDIQMIEKEHEESDVP